MARKETWMPIAAGVLCIIAGATELFGGLILSALASLITAFFWMPELGALFGVPLIIVGIVAIIGGICSLTRRAWGMALAGAICSLFLPHVIILGILAIIFVAISKQEFK
jgi:hypothetical protein